MTNYLRKYSFFLSLLLSILINTLPGKTSLLEILGSVGKSLPFILACDTNTDPETQLKFVTFTFAYLK